MLTEGTATIPGATVLNSWPWKVVRKERRGSLKTKMGKVIDYFMCSWTEQ